MSNVSMSDLSFIMSMSNVCIALVTLIKRLLTLLTYFLIYRINPELKGVNPKVNYVRKLTQEMIFLLNN
jgi:hypothetical protein